MTAVNFPWPPTASAQYTPAEREAVLRLDPERLPRHVAIIMDGNGRWARQRGFLDRIRGHEAGIDSVREASRTAAQLHLDALTLYAFSKENWRRPNHEISALMALLARFLVAERSELNDNNIRLATIGDIGDLPDKVQDALAETKRLTAANTGLVLNLALSYGGRDEIVRAIRTLATDARAGKLDPATIDETTVTQALDTAALPEPDLLIRTSGELRVSNFLLWQIAYSEIHVTQTLWPDFRRAHFFEALLDYQSRERRYGMVVETTKK